MARIRPVNPIPVSCIFILILAALPVASPRKPPSVEVEITPQEITVFPLLTEDFRSMTVRIVDPENRKVLDTTTWGEGVVWSPEAESVEGYYRYEVTVILAEPGWPATEEEELQGIRRSRQKQISGIFELSGGQILAQTEVEEPEKKGEEALLPGHSAAVTQPDPLEAMAVQEFTDDIRVKNGDPFIHFNDTDETLQYDEFELGVMSNSFLLIDRINDNTPLIVRASPMNHFSLEVDSNGDVGVARGNFFFDRSEGNLGIGTTTPPHNLSIYSTFPAIELEDSDSNSSPDTSTGVNMRGGIFLTNDELMLFTRSFSDSASWPFIIQGVPWSNSLTIVSQNVDARVADEGYVGVGTLTPAAKLHVKSETGTARVTVEESDATTAVRTQFHLKNNGAPRFALENTTSGTEWSFQQSGPGNFLISKEGTRGPEVQVYTTGRVRMGPGGAVNFDLAPNGNLTIAGSLTANGSTFPDYVFESDYELMPLSDLRAYIEQNQRLPEIPSAEEVKQAGGHNMTELQLKLLEKIEELTLYTLEQQPEITSLREQLKGMKALETELAEIRGLLSDH